MALVPEPPVPRAYRLNPSFANSLRQALQGGGSGHSFGVPASKDSGPAITVAELDSFARQQWEGILYFIVGSVGSNLHSATPLSKSTRTLLEWGEYVRFMRDKPTITNKGFSFLLRETNSQVWSLLIVYLKHSEQVLDSDHTATGDWILTL